MNKPPIHIPWTLRLRRWRDRFVPIVVFVALVALAIWLWDRHTGHSALVGEVEHIRIDLASPANGVLVAPPGGSIAPLERFDRVQAGQVIARLDDRPALAALATLQTRIVQSRHERAAAVAAIEQARRDLHREDAVNFADLVLEVQRQRLNVLDRRGAIEGQRIELQRLTEEMEHVQQLAEQQAETDFTLRLATLRRGVLATQIEQSERALAEALRHLGESERLLEELPELIEAPLSVQVQPLRDAIDVLEAQMRELEFIVSALQIRSPISGEVAAVHAHPGQAVAAGQPLLTIADPRAKSVVVYFRERGAAWPEPGMNVSVFSNRARSHVLGAAISHVGAQVELVPEHHRVDPMVPEWGLPVRIDLPPELSVHPGELVGVLIAR